MTQQFIPSWMHPSSQSLGLSGLPLATWSPCTLYRYTLRRVWRSVEEPRVVTWILLNPSTADEFRNDATIRRCIGFSSGWGFDELMIVNAYAYRSTKPRGLRSRECAAAGGPVGDGNDAAITAACARAEQVVCGWGRHLQPDRRAALARLLAGVKLYALATNEDGSPSHPLRLQASLEPQRFKLWECPMSESVEAAVTAVEQALDALLAAVQAELARVALIEGVTRMDFGLGSTYYRGAQEVECRRLDEVEDRYLRYASGGFLAYWTAEEGWT